jgi:hypothetical protein
MLIALFFIWLFSAIIVSMFDIKLSLGLMIAYRLLVPYSSFVFSSIPVEYNYILLLIFCIFLFKEVFLNNERIDYTIIKPLVIFSVLIIIGSFFSYGIESAYQLSILRSYIIGYFLIPVMLWHVCKTKSDINYFARIILISITFMLIYGLYCFFTHSNPYITTLSSLFNMQDNNEIFSDMERGGLIGKIQSTTSHPFYFSVILSLTLFGSYSLWDKKKGYVYFFFLVLLLINLFVCNVRTGIVASALGVAFMFTHFSMRIKILSITVIIAILLLSVDTSIFGKFQPFIDSIIYFNDSEKSTRGSSLETRLLQLGGAVSLWEQGGILFGNGFGWCVNYYTLYGDHPILLGFESIIYVIIIENGVLGIFLYIYLFYSFFKINRDVYILTQNENKTNFWLINSMIIAYISFSIITGLFGFNIFLIFLILMLLKVRINSQNDDTESIEQKSIA